MALDSRDILLKLFADNQTQSITASDMRTFVNAVYNELFNKMNVRDDLGTSDPDKALSSRQGVILDEKIQALENEIQELKQRVQFLEGINGTTATFNTSDNITIRVENGIVAEVY